ncbi:MAG: VOC family protein [Promethearchaeia archaeon]
MKRVPKLKKFDQIGIVVKDIEKSAELYRALFDFRGKINIVEQDASVTCRGEKGTYKMKKIMEFFGEKQMEIVEIVEADGPNLYTEFLEEGREGLHHLGIYTKKADELIQTFENEFDVKPIQVGEVGKLTFYYLDTLDRLGYFLELIEF